MRRHAENVFEPIPVLSTAETSNLVTLEPPVGPAPEWTAEGVIAALEPLATDERSARMRETIVHRLGCVTVLFDNPHDPHNGSAILRSCDAFGVQRVHVVRHHESFAVSRLISKGSDRWIDLIQHEDPQVALAHLRSEGFRLLVTHPKGNLKPQDLNEIPRVALIFGNERDGVSEALSAAADDTVQIPMRGFVESLNVSVTAAILLQAATSGRQGDFSEGQLKNIYARWLRKSVPRADEVLVASPPC